MVDFKIFGLQRNKYKFLVVAVCNRPIEYYIKDVEKMLLMLGCNGDVIFDTGIFKGNIKGRFLKAPFNKGFDTFVNVDLDIFNPIRKVSSVVFRKHYKSLCKSNFNDLEIEVLFNGGVI